MYYSGWSPLHRFVNLLGTIQLLFALQEKTAHEDKATNTKNSQKNIVEMLLVIKKMLVC